VLDESRQTMLSPHSQAENDPNTKSRVLLSCPSGPCFELARHAVAAQCEL
jgi:hypothetical protein